MKNQGFGRKLSLILRHKAKELGLEVCNKVWLKVSELLKHIHINKKVGKRAQVSFMLGIDIERLLQNDQQIYQSSNGVLLVRYIPADCIVAIKPMTKKDHKQIEELQFLYKWQ